MRIEKFGYTVEFETTGSTLPPGMSGIGGSAVCSWYRINKGDWKQLSSREFGPVEKVEMYETTSKERFMELLKMLQDETI